MNSTSLPDDVENSVALALADGEIALWLGPDWRGEENADQVSTLSQYDWLGVWSESRDPSTAEVLSHAWTNRPFRRTFVEVPDQIHEALDRDFKFSRACPFFYLEGRGPGEDKL